MTTPVCSGTGHHGFVPTRRGVPAAVNPTDDARAARRLAAQARQVGRVSGRQGWREALRWISRGRLGRRTGWPSVPQLDTPWRDTVSAERSRCPALPVRRVFAWFGDYENGLLISCAPVSRDHDFFSGGDRRPQIADFFFLAKKFALLWIMKIGHLHVRALRVRVALAARHRV